MRQSLLSRLAKRSVRQGQIGQTIVIMAFGFIVLLAFVGIVTDVSLMFVRYSTLRRAVDAAAVAAAGQIRRTVATPQELASAGNNQTVANGLAFARSVVNINLAARQFIEFYGLSPSNVSVDSCDTLQRDPAKPGYDLQSLTLLECTNNFQPRKLVRVTAQLPSPTVFLRLIGWGTVTLEASAISETAVLDVVMMFDAAETMLKQTTYDDWAKVPVVDSGGGLTYDINGVITEDRSLRYLPVKVNRWYANWNSTGALFSYWPAANGDWIKMWSLLLNNMTQQDIYNDKVNFPEVAFTWDRATSQATQVTNATYLNLHQPRQDCRVRFFPFAESIGTQALVWSNATIPSDLQNSYTALLRSKGTLANNVTYDNPPASDNGQAKFDGFIPAYDYYGCCNDPNGDNKFDDLICQPFKKVRDATEKFLDHVDFVRGDRVAFVTFDRTAYLIDPDGSEDTTNPTDPNRKGIQTPMITSQDNAVAALRRIVGVRAEPSFYADTDDDGKWNTFVTGGTPYTGVIGKSGNPINYDRRLDMKTNVWHTGSVPGELAGYNNTLLGSLNDYPVRYNCLFQNATLTYPFSVYSSQASQTDNAAFNNAAALFQISYPYDSAKSVTPSRWPTPLAAWERLNPTKPGIMNPSLNDLLWNASMKSNPDWTTKDYSRQVAKATFSYEYRAACGGNNVGAALRVGNNALLDPKTVRIGNTGAVWVMVLLGDGAAGASDPVQRNGAPLSNGDPYRDDKALAPLRGEYGGFGLCPYGTPDDQMSLTSGWISGPPRCSDDGSELSNGGVRGIMGATSRHFCEGSAVGDNNNSTIDILKTGKADCVNKYDVDDYARDWADFIGLTQLPAMSPFTSLPDVDSQRNLLQLPTIFTIGFGIDFPDAPAGTCSETSASTDTNITDCLGEELLRYIADVGDNNRIDTDYQQDYLNDGVINGITADSSNLYEGYGDRGPCEGPIGIYSNAKLAGDNGAFSANFNALRNNPLPPKKNCGNYYNAPGGPQLTKVFEDIASRMFTRITK